MSESQGVTSQIRGFSSMITLRMVVASQSLSNGRSPLSRQMVRPFLFFAPTWLAASSPPFAALATLPVSINASQAATPDGKGGSWIRHWLAQSIPNSPKGRRTSPDRSAVTCMSIVRE